MSAIPVLETARLRLRQRTADDAEALFPSFSDPALMTYWSHGPHESVEQTRAKFAEPFDVWRGWAITLHGDDRAIGFVAAGDKRPGVYEIGYMLARDHWGTGIAREAVGAVLDQLFRVEQQRRVFADTDPDNVPSNTLLESLGFQREGLLRAEWETHIGIRDTVLWGLLASEWIDR
ncbi:GNAT family protein [Sphingomonas sp. RB3P16]|uniref:GNAT family N-acetyltransferase n=1 Tax=Parasphingomonas frigoris TaxID=3096163 RepID=UPI002FCC3BBB